jgi:hypothetical protein
LSRARRRPAELAVQVGSRYPALAEVEVKGLAAELAREFHARVHMRIKVDLASHGAGVEELVVLRGETAAVVVMRFKADLAARHQIELDSSQVAS